MTCARSRQVAGYEVGGLPHVQVPHPGARGGDFSEGGPLWVAVSPACQETSQSHAAVGLCAGTAAITAFVVFLFLLANPPHTPFLWFFASPLAITFLSSLSFGPDSRGL